MDWSRQCFECYKFTIIEELEDRYICKCDMCGSIFTKWKMNYK